MELDLQANVTCCFANNGPIQVFVFLVMLIAVCLLHSMLFFIPEIKSFASIGLVAILSRHISISYPKLTYCSLTSLI